MKQVTERSIHSQFYYDIFETIAGWVGVVASAQGVRRATMPQESPNDCAESLDNDLRLAVHEPKHLRDFKTNIRRYLAGEMVDFSRVQTDFSDAPEFMRAAWEACRSIPYGETRSYKWLAAMAGRPNASRAAGQAMARNRIPFLVPCHRVISSDGGIGGYGGGKRALILKRWLIDNEVSSTSGLQPPLWWES